MKLLYKEAYVLVKGDVQQHDKQVNAWSVRERLVPRRPTEHCMEMSAPQGQETLFASLFGSLTYFQENRPGM